MGFKAGVSIYYTFVVIMGFKAGVSIYYTFVVIVLVNLV